MNTTTDTHTVTSVRRLSTLGERARTASDVHDALGEELLRLLGVDEVHLQHLSQTGEPELAVGYTLAGELVRHPYPIPPGARDAGVEWVASTGRALVAARPAALGAGLVGRPQMAGAALLALALDGHVAAVVVLVSQDPEALGDEQLELAGMLVEIAATALALIDARTAARTDTLTGLMNHGAMISRLHEEIDRARRQGTSLACLLVDLDDFKLINDRYGHLMGDGILCQVAETLRREFRRFDRVARPGGDEFVVVLPNADATHAASAARRALERLRAIRIQTEGVEHSLTASIGMGCWQEADTPNDLLARADAALRDGKSAGKNQLGGGRSGTGRFSRPGSLQA